MRLIIITLATLFAGNVLANSEVFAYPNQGQSQEQQRQDRYECHVWAVQQSGFDPSTYRAPTATSPYRTASHRRHGHTDINPITGAAGGAAAGAVGGAIAGNAGKGAAIGAGVGAVAGLLHKASYDSKKARMHKTKAEQEEQEVYALRQDYNRAIGACLEGRDYTVK